MANRNISRKRTTLAEMLIAEFLEPHGTTVDEFNERVDFDVWALVSGNLPMTDDIAGELARALGTSKQFWLNLRDAQEGD